MDERCRCRLKMEVGQAIDRDRMRRTGYFDPILSTCTGSGSGRG